MGATNFDVWNATQSALTAIYIAFYPFVISLLYQIRHEMASNPYHFMLRKIILITCMVAKLVIFTFLRDQYVWNENINKREQVPNQSLCALSRFSYFGIIEISTFFLIVMIIWDETESLTITKYQLNAEIVRNAKLKAAKHRFFLSNFFKVYLFCTAALTLIPSSFLSSPLDAFFTDGIDDNYRCTTSDVAAIISITNHSLFFSVALYSSIHLRRTESRFYLSNTIALFCLIPIYCVLNTLLICNDNAWLVICTVDTSRRIQFGAAVIFIVGMTCTHIMMQAQAKQHVAAAAQRFSRQFNRLSVAFRQSMGNINVFPLAVQSTLHGTNKIEVETKTAAADDRDRFSQFSVAEVTEDQYDSVVIGSINNGDDIDCDDAYEEELQQTQTEEDTSALSEDRQNETENDPLSSNDDEQDAIHADDDDGDENEQHIPMPVLTNDDTTDNDHDIY
mmetsp:Transcript_37601/g.61809  ORF Transcript_37601/g.61809 Transcript_37601/m.61809 type:complete len:449 (-) Transcript_37601:2-1348(-)